MLLTLSLLLLLIQRQTYAAGRCQFPSELRGRWYQSGLGQVTIRKNSLSGKGVCRDHQRDYFLLENRDEDCFRCLLMMSRHRNIIQYKETYCVTKNTLHNICAGIQVEATLYTLVREPSSPTRCPLSVAYYFDYNDGESRFCDSGRSYVKPCVGHRRLQMHFEHCSENAQLHGQDAEVECLGTWKVGSDTYMYGRFTGSQLPKNEEPYRCFQYELYGSEVYMAMSADASCRGLRTTREGPLVLKLSQDVNGWPKPSCHFPDWLVSASWRDLAGKHLYNSSGGSQTFVGFSRRKSSAKLHRRSEYRCIETPRHVTDAGIYTVLTFSTHECVSKYQCLQFRRLADGVLKLKEGKLMDLDTTTRCLAKDQYQTAHIITGTSDDKLKSRKCPKPGIYRAPSPTNCYSWADVGCHQHDAIVFHSSCPETPDLTLRCSSSHWRHSNYTYAVVTKSENGSSFATCFRVRRGGAVTELSTDSLCGGGGSHAQKSAAVELLLAGTRERCPGNGVETSDDETIEEIPDVKESIKNIPEDDVVGNGLSSDNIRTNELRTKAPSDDVFVNHHPVSRVGSKTASEQDDNNGDNRYENIDVHIKVEGRTKAVIAVSSGTEERPVVSIASMLFAVALWYVLAN